MKFRELSFTIGAMDEGTRLVAESIDERRIDLGLKWQDVAHRAGISALTLRRFRNGDEASWTRDNIRSIERALEWPRGTIDALLAGDEPPEPDPDPEPEAPAMSIDEQIAYMDEQIASLNRYLESLRRQRDIG